MNITQIQANSLAELPEGYRTRAIAEILGIVNAELFKCFAVLKADDSKFYRDFIEDSTKEYPEGSAEKIVGDDILKFIGILDETREKMKEQCLPLKRLYELQDEIAGRCECAKCQAKSGGGGLPS